MKLVPDGVPTTLSLEEARIRHAYALRTDDERYSFFDQAHLLAVQERERLALRLLRQYGYGSLARARIVELGCGTGFWLRELVKWGADPRLVSGIELLEDRAAEARRLCPPAVMVRCENAAMAELQSDGYDLVLQSMAFTSVLDPALRERLARKMLHALRPGGLILWYDYHVDNPWNRDVRGVPRHEIEHLFAGCHIDLRRLTLAAPLARVVLSRSQLAYSLLRRIPLLRTHYLGVIQKPSPAS